MYSIKTNLLLGITIVICYVLVSVYSTKLGSISRSEQTHVYGTENAYGMHYVPSSRVSLSDLIKRGAVNKEAERTVISSFKHTSEFSSVSGVTQYSGGRSISYLPTDKGIKKKPQPGSSENRTVRIEKLRVASVLNSFIFLLGASIFSLVLVGENQKTEFDEKMLFLCALILINFVFIGGQSTMLLPLIGLAMLHGRRYLGKHFMPHEE